MIFVIVDTLNKKLLLENLKPHSREKLYIFPLLSYREEDNLIEILKNVEFEFEVIQISGKLEIYSKKLKHDYTKFIDQIPFTIKVKNNNIHEYKYNKYNLWWLSEPSTKRSDAFITFTRFLQLSIIKEHINKDKDTIILFSNDKKFIQCFINSFVNKVQVVPSNKAKVSENSFSFSLIKLCIKNLVWILTSSFKVLYIKIICFRTHINERENIFYSVFPKLWIGKKYENDEKYSSLFFEEFGTKNKYLISLINNGFIQKITFKDIRKCSENQSVKGNYLVDQFTTIFSIIEYIYESFKLLFLFIQIDAGLRRNSKCNGINIYQYLKLELLQSYFNIPRIIWESRKVENFFKKAKPKNFIYYLYEWTLGRSFLYTLYGKTNTKFIGFQHGPVNPYRLYTYFNFSLGDFVNFNSDFSKMPHPDEIWLEDQESLNTLISSGYPENMLRIKGSKRTDYIKNIKPKVENSRNNILVAAGLSDGKLLFDIISPFLCTRNFNIKFKTHPRSSFNNKKLDLYLINMSCESSIICNSSITDALEWADIVVGSYSSVLEEALSIGKEIVLCLNARKYTESSLIDNFSIHKAYSIESLKTIFDELCNV